jgi:hypothetical protein
MAKQQLPTNVREAGLRTVGAILYLAASPDEADGLSDIEFLELKSRGPEFFKTYQLVQRVLPEGVQLPPGFAEHFTRDVLPDLERVRNDPGARNQFRSEVRDALSSPGKLDKLYTPGGDTFSDMLHRAAEQSGARAGDAILKQGELIAAFGV